MYGCYGVVRTNGIFAKLIRLGTLSAWNHAVVYIGNDQIIEANPTGVEIKPVSEYPEGAIAWNRHEELSVAERTAIVAHAHAQVGKMYSFATIALLVFRILGLRALSNSKTFTRLAKKEGYICSELVSECYRSAGVVLSQKPDNLVTPADLALRLMFQ